MHWIWCPVCRHLHDCDQGPHCDGNHVASRCQKCKATSISPYAGLYENRTYTDVPFSKEKSRGSPTT